MVALKTLAAGFPREIGSVDKFYERQRALVRANLLPQDKGRGPGSGVRATPETLTVLLLSVLATNSVSEVAHAVTSAAAMKLSISTVDRPPWKGATFADGLKWVLSSPDNAARVNNVTVSHNGKFAHIELLSRGKRTSPLFGFGNYGAVSDFEVSVRISGNALKLIADQLHAA